MTVISSKSSGWHNNHVNVLKSESFDKVSRLFLFSNASLPWCNRTGWLGIKHQVTYLLKHFLSSARATPTCLSRAWQSFSDRLQCFLLMPRRMWRYGRATCVGEMSNRGSWMVLEALAFFTYLFPLSLNLGWSFSSWVTSLAVVLDFSVSAALTLHPRRDVWLVSLPHHRFLTGCHSLQTGTLWFSFLITLWFACYRLWELDSGCCARLSKQPWSWEMCSVLNLLLWCLQLAA